MSDFKDEIIAHAAYLANDGKGILAAGEFTGTIDRPIHWIDFLETGGVLQYFNGAILSADTIYQKTAGGKPFVVVLKENGVLIGIEVDKDTVELAGANGETTTQGLGGLAEHCKTYYQAGARFAKCRAMFKISPNELSQPAINENANGLAQYAIICQENGLVPILETEILVDGPHDIEKCAQVTERVLAACYKALNDHHVLLEGTLLMLNMVTPGSDSPKVAPEVVAEYTVRALQRTVPVAVPAVVFLSSGQSEEEATLNLNAINQVEGKKPWGLSFVIGIAHAWAGKKENMKKAQAAYLARAKANSEAALGTYQGGTGLRLNI